jgi:hypothetical protein
MGTGLRGLSSVIQLTVTIAVLLLVALGTVPLIGQAQETINNSRNVLPDGALDTGPDDNNGDDGPDVTGPEDTFTSVEFNDPPRVVAAGNAKTFEATANANRPLTGATFSIDIPEEEIPEGVPNNYEEFSSCGGDPAGECTVRKQLSFPYSGLGYKAEVKVQFETAPEQDGVIDPDSIETETTQTTIQVIMINIDKLEGGKFDANAAARYGVALDGARLRWATEADVEPSGSTAKNVECGEDLCRIPATSLDLPNSLGGTYQAEVIAEFYTTTGEAAATKTIEVERKPGLEIAVKEENNGETVSVPGIGVFVQDTSVNTNDDGVARFNNLKRNTIKEIFLHCNEPSYRNVREGYNIDPSERNTVELDLQAASPIPECTSTDDIEEKPGLEIAVKEENNGETMPVPGIKVSVQDTSINTNDDGVARFEGLDDNTINKIELYCNDPLTVEDKDTSIDPSERDTVEVELVGDTGGEGCESTER